MTPRLVLHCLLAACFVFCHAVTAAEMPYRTAPKFALVIGNADYPGDLRLRNAAADARLIAAGLQQAGYSTELVLDADRARLFGAVGRLAERLRGGGVGAFYYAGHGVEVDGRNFLIPARTAVAERDTVLRDAFPVDYLVGRLHDSGAHLSLILLDACRNEPLAFAPRYRGGGTGFVAQQPANGMLLAYATQPGARARDGDGRHSPFAAALADWLPRPGLPIEQAIKHVMTDVMKATGGGQRPWLSTSLVGDFALVPAAGAEPMLVDAGMGRNVDGSRARGIEAETEGDARRELMQRGYAMDDAAMARAIETCDLVALALYRRAGVVLPFATPVFGSRGGSNLERPIMAGTAGLAPMLDLLAPSAADLDRRYMLTFTQAQTGEIPRFGELLDNVPPAWRPFVQPSIVKANALALAVWSGNDAAIAKLLALGADPDVGVDVLAPALRDGMPTGQLTSVQIASARSEARRLGRPLPATVQ